MVITSLTECTRKKYEVMKLSAHGPLMAPGLHIPGNSQFLREGWRILQCHMNLMKTRAVRRTLESKANIQFKKPKGHRKDAFICMNCFSLVPAFPEEHPEPKKVNSSEVHPAHITINTLLFMNLIFSPKKISFLVGGCLPISELKRRR